MTSFTDTLILITVIAAGLLVLCAVWRHEGRRGRGRRLP